MTSELGTVATEVKRIEPSSSYRTLGVHITPSGDSKGALKVLMEAALTYCSNIVSSKLTRQETLTSYIQYLLPKLRYQPPLLQLTKRECDKLMAPVLQAILPKMHINRNTSRAIIHGPEELGGLALPHLHTIQGIEDKVVCRSPAVKGQDSKTNLHRLNLHSDHYRHWRILLKQRLYTLLVGRERMAYLLMGVCVSGQTDLFLPLSLATSIAVTGRHFPY